MKDLTRARQVLLGFFFRTRAWEKGYITPCITMNERTHWPKSHSISAVRVSTILMKFNC